MKNKKRAVWIFLFGIILAAALGCGRKMPPLPPGPGDPVEIVSIDFLKDGTVEAKARCNSEGAKVALLGKPKDICPLCTDNLKKKDEVTAEKEGIVVLKDAKPEGEYMVYRFSLEKGTSSFLTPPRVVRK